MQAGQSFAPYFVWILFQATPAKNVWPPHPKSQVSTAHFLCLDHEVHASTISVKTLVWGPPGLPDLLCCPCNLLPNKTLQGKYKTRGP